MGPCSSRSRERTTQSRCRVWEALFRQIEPVCSEHFIYLFVYRWMDSSRKNDKKTKRELFIRGFCTIEARGANAMHRPMRLTGVVRVPRLIPVT